MVLCPTARASIRTESATNPTDSAGYFRIGKACTLFLRKVAHYFLKADSAVKVRTMVVAVIAGNPKTCGTTLAIAIIVILSLLAAVLLATRKKTDPQPAPPMHAAILEQPLSRAEFRENSLLTDRTARAPRVRPSVIQPTNLRASSKATLGQT